ncbi:Uncharacterized protein TCAP_06899 [Tolypocladium capitatum]|uniref:BTB domain-containing protein n=1 Tax=Tolypocladium capitatum TaxID=45235 RepID=A0A2K3Q6P4_9HYPO|nr:Uncharacterized protein TCAP_06899 [Tolypocladium capitatum]
MPVHDCMNVRVNHGACNQAASPASPAPAATATVYPQSSFPTTCAEARSDCWIMIIVGHSCTPFLVDASILKEASPILCTKITMAEREGPDVSFDGATVLTLYDDDVVAIQNLFSILHGDDWPIITDADGLYKLAVVAGKYECVGHISLAADHFFNQMADAAHNSAALWKLLAAACILKHSVWFQEFSSRVAQEHQGSFLSLVKETGDGFLGLRLGLAMEEKRNLGRPRRNGVLCLDCFENATTTFAPNAFCRTCTGPLVCFMPPLGGPTYRAAIPSWTWPGVSARDLAATRYSRHTDIVLPTNPATGGSLFHPTADGPS